MSAPNNTTEPTKDKSSNVFIYVLQRLSDSAFLYLGSTRDPQRRFNEHKHNNLYAIIRAAFANNDIRFIVIAQTTEECRIDLETRLWRQFKDAGHPVVNRNPSVAWTKFIPNEPRVVTEQTRQKMAENARKRRGEKRSAIARLNMSLAAKKKAPLTEEHRRKIGEAGKGRVPWNKGQTIDDDMRQKLSLSHKGVVFTEEHKQKIGQAHKGRKRSPETCANISAAKTGKPGHPQSEESKRKNSIAHTGKKRAPFSSEWKRKLSEAQKKRWARWREENPR